MLRVHSLFRSVIWRIGRKLYCWARLEVSKGPEINGEFWLLEQAIKRSSVTSPCFFDIGARFGDWAKHAQDMLNHSGIAGHVQAFEPSNASYEFLTKRFNQTDLVQIHKLAFSDQTGLRNFYVVCDFDGINSFTPVNGAQVEQVDTMKIDDYLVQQCIDKVQMVKSDAEGHDFKIMQGATELFLRGGVEIWQFEYNHRWLDCRTQLKDVFDFIVNKPYLLGKLYADGIEVYEEWHPELERYFEANFVLVRQGSEFEKICNFVGFNCRNVLQAA